METCENIKKKKKTKKERIVQILGILCFLASLRSTVRFQRDVSCQYFTTTTEKKKNNKKKNETCLGRTSTSTGLLWFGDVVGNTTITSPMAWTYGSNDVERQEIVTNKLQSTKNIDTDTAASTQQQEQKRQYQHYQADEDNQRNLFINTRLQPKRLFLAIFASLDDLADRQLRHVIRHTYLQYYQKIYPHLKIHKEYYNMNYTNIENKSNDNDIDNDNNTILQNMNFVNAPEICSWKKFLKRYSEHTDVDNNNTSTIGCNIVYTFVVNSPVQKSSKQQQQEGQNQPSSSQKNKNKFYYYRTNPYTIDPSWIDNHEDDVLYLNRLYLTSAYYSNDINNNDKNSNKNNNGGDKKNKKKNNNNNNNNNNNKGQQPLVEKTQPTLVQVLTLYRYLLWETTTVSSSSSKNRVLPSSLDVTFDYIAYMDAKVLPCPSIQQLWPTSSSISPTLSGNSFAFDELWWKKNIPADGESSKPKSNSTASISFPTVYFYGGWSDREDDMDKDGERKASVPTSASIFVDENVKFERFVMLSANLIPYLVERADKEYETKQSSSTKKQEKKKDGASLPSLLSSSSSSPSISNTLSEAILSSSPDEWIASKLHTFSNDGEESNPLDANNSNILDNNVVWKIRNFRQSIRVVKSSRKHLTLELLSSWERYKDSIIEYGPYIKQRSDKYVSVSENDENGTDNVSNQYDNKDSRRVNSYLPSNESMDGTIPAASSSLLSLSSAAPLPQEENHYQQRQEQIERPRMILGIFTTDDPTEAKRRDLIRQSYLKFYQHANKKTDTEYHRICPLQSFLDDEIVQKHCQLVYTFVLGGRQRTFENNNFHNISSIHNNGKNNNNSSSAWNSLHNKTNTGTVKVTDLIGLHADWMKEQTSSSSVPLRMTVPPFALQQPPNNNDDNSDNNNVLSASEGAGASTTATTTTVTKSSKNNMKGRSMEPNDILFLNIHENMNHGKSQSWFFYASQLRWKLHQTNEQNQMDTNNDSASNGSNNKNNDEDATERFDYVGKIDSDTIFYPDIFLDSILNKLSSFPNNVRYYGGSNVIVKASNDERLSGPYYFAGSFYILSWDLASYISSNDCPRSTWDVQSEDKTIGNFIHSHPFPIRFFICWKTTVHPVKKIYHYRNMWNQHVKKYYSPEHFVEKKKRMRQSK